VKGRLGSSRGRDGFLASMDIGPRLIGSSKRAEGTVGAIPEPPRGR
jgi:hypothetical protein